MSVGPHRISERLRRDRRGVSAIEFAFIAPVMIMLMLGAFDFGNAAQQQIQLQQAVRAGGAYAISRPTDLAGIQEAVSAGLPDRWKLSGSVTTTCSCSDGSLSAGTCDAPGLGGCSANSAKTISITATLAYAPLFFTAIPTNPTATYVVRFQ